MSAAQASATLQNGLLFSSKFKMSMLASRDFSLLSSKAGICCFFHSLLPIAAANLTQALPAGYAVACLASMDRAVLREDNTKLQVGSEFCMLPSRSPTPELPPDIQTLSPTRAPQGLRLGLCVKLRSFHGLGSVHLRGQELRLPRQHGGITLSPGDYLFNPVLAGLNPI